MRHCIGGFLALVVPLWLGTPIGAGTKAGTQKDVVGFWQGTLKAGPVSLRLLIRVEGKPGAYSATLDSPDENLTDLPVTELKVADSSFAFTMKLTGAKYEGKLNEQHNEITGNWKQSGLTIPLTFKRLDKKPSFARPQEPKRPYPYRDEEVVFENAKAKIKLAGTLTSPKGDGPFAAVMLITGSGPQDRDESLLGHKPFLVLADYLTRKGIAALRVDDRGVGKSTGKFAGATTLDFAEDIKAGVTFLRTRPEIDGNRIGLVGHSEGGIIAPMVAAADKKLAFIVLLAGTGLPGDEISNSQVLHLLTAAKLDKQKIEEKMAVQRRMMNVFKTVDDDDKAYEAFEAIFDEEIAKLDEKDKKLAVAQKKLALELQFNKGSYAWTRFFARHDPRPVFAKVSCPVLAVIGEKDFQVPAKDNLKALEKALKDSGNKDYVVRELPGLNHLFQTCKTGGMEEYGVIDETLSPVLLELVGDWITRRTKSRN